MYEKLLKRLRECGHGCNEGRECPMLHDDLVEATHGSSIYRVCCSADEAADAIEELQRAVYFHKYNSEFWEDKYNSLADEKWIPVTETPPRKVGDDGYNGYLVYANGYYEVADYKGYFHVDGEYEPDVTHYMPLPEPPKEET